MLRSEELGVLERKISSCRLCPRLVAWREQVAREKRASFKDEVYWGRPVPGFGDPEADVVVFGLAPAAHGANRTGRYFTGDRSGDFLFAALYRAGFASSPVSRGKDDGMRLSGLWISAAVRCAPPQNKPTPRRARRLPPLRRPRTGAARREGHRLPRGLRLGRGPATAGGEAKTEILPRCRTQGRSARSSRLLSPFAAEHLHRFTHPRDARRRPVASAEAIRDEITVTGLTGARITFENLAHLRDVRPAPVVYDATAKMGG